MGVATLAAGALQVAGLALAPLLPGTIQAIKARLQGRRGPSPLQPYRELRRLWTKSSVLPADSGRVYLFAPAVVAAAAAAALIIVPVAGESPRWPLGDDALVMVGMLVLARFAITAAAWDTGSGFALMSAARDLMIAVFLEGLLALAVLLAALPAGGTDLQLMSAASAGSQVWSDPTHWCAMLAFALVVVCETGRQPVDNPDTHLELTMIHEGPLLEYAGRDLAYLQWASSARHWLMLLLAAELFLPHWGPFWVRLLLLLITVPLFAAALALNETWQAKMRLIRVPRFVGAGVLVALLGLAGWILGGGT
jgi:formate hydrogenlyase subunit 4